MAFSYNELYKRYEELKDKYNTLSYNTKQDIRRKDNTIKHLKRQVDDDTRIIQNKNKAIKEYELIIGWLLERRG